MGSNDALLHFLFVLLGGRIAVGGTDTGWAKDGFDLWNDSECLYIYAKIYDVFLISSTQFNILNMVGGSG